ncbi:MAG: glycogen/starch synthase [Paludibacteraceae bacterium]|nr:glycogen/starch synthase [Paludibacteraceae bacterium]
MSSVKILYVTQEMVPYLPSTELAEMSRKLPQAIQEQGREIRIFMPKYGCINERRNQLHEVIRLSGMNLIIDDTDHQLIIKVASLPAARMQVYFIDNDDYFRRKFTVADADGTEYADNGDRIVFYARGVLETVKKLRWTPDIIHCHGWFTSLLPAYIKRVYSDDPFFADSKVVYSVYDKDYQNPLSDTILKHLCADGIAENEISTLKSGASYANLCKFAVDFSDGVVQGSREVDAEVMKYARQEGKMILDYADEESYVSAYNDFYNKILGQ